MAHRDTQDRWDRINTEMRQGVPPLRDPTQINIPISASVRIRFEPNARDAINSRVWETIQYDTKAPNSADIKASNQPVYNDMNPIASRTSINDYNQQAQFFPNPKRPAPKVDENGDVTKPEPPKLETSMIKNPYLQRLDPINDARNIPREMRGAVHEDNRERDIDAARSLAERQFNYRFLPEREAAKASVLLRPKMENYSKSLRN
jgi:hypothetical protein